MASAETDDRIDIEIVAGGGLVVKHVVPDTDQHDLKSDQANLYTIPVAVPFTRASMAADAVRIGVNGDDMWYPRRIFLFGLDNREGRPVSIIPLVHLDGWRLGPLSTDRDEGLPQAVLPLLPSTLATEQPRHPRSRPFTQPRCGETRQPPTVGGQVAGDAAARSTGAVFDVPVMRYSCSQWLLAHSLWPTLFGSAEKDASGRPRQQIESSSQNPGLCRWRGRETTVRRSDRLALTKGELVDLVPRDGLQDGRVDASDGPHWGPARHVDAALLAALLTQKAGAKGLTHRAVRLKGARITGSLDLQAAILTRPLVLQFCSFECPIMLGGAQALSVELFGCDLPGLYADGLHTRGDLRLPASVVTGEVRLCSAHIGARLECAGAQFRNEGQKALEADGLIVDGYMSCRTEVIGGKVRTFMAKAEVRLPGAHIKGDLYLEGGNFDGGEHVPSESRRAVLADGLVVDGSIFCRPVVNDAGQVIFRFTAHGLVSMSGAQIGGQLECVGAKFLNEGGDALAGDLMVIKGHVLGRDLEVAGTIRLPGARIGGGLDCSGGTFRNPGKDALVGDNLIVEGDVFFVDGFVADGTVRLPGARIGGQLNCTGGAFRNRGKNALVGDRLIVEGSAYFDVNRVSFADEFVADGTVRLPGARIGGHLDCTGGAFRNPGKDALVGDRLIVDGDVSFATGFVADGTVRLPGARIGGQLNCTWGGFHNERSDKYALSLERAEIAEAVYFRPTPSSTGGLNLMFARVGAWHDAKDTWPGKGSLRLDGFEYTHVYAKPSISIRRRLNWLGRDADGFVPQSYEHLAAVCRRQGREREARQVQVAAQWRRRAVVLWPLHPVWNTLVRVAAAAADALVGAAAMPYLVWNALIRLAARAADTFGRRERAARWRRGLTSTPGSFKATAKSSISDWRAAQLGDAGQAFRRERPRWARLVDVVLSPVRLLWSVLLWAFLGYGYRPLRIIWPVGLLLAFGSWWFAAAHDRGEIKRAPNLNPAVDFHAVRYTADLLVPGASLGERMRFVATGEAAWWALGFTLAGWALAGMLLAGLVGVFRSPK